ncbi:substrate-binding and VWA domain-containing protein [Actinoplanes sp. KI2]|uniref:substrate-binding and VWA domain-containing protein n=1 Tax=Actinoplanes sp. KI2 TaxID=2983315 RepID=UPI0021D60815|nr:substrate-binding and VWA domain-containing protein [Actinoplanes sp. KI2]MCU7724983.1 substrate-binding and VWA domain-containing protein [Actinoplanes sp. KI2]
MPGRHRQLHRTGLIVTAAAAAVAVVAGGSWAGYRALSGDSCATTERLRVAAAPEVAPAVTAAAATWSKDAKVGNACVAVDVSAADPAAMAAAVGTRHGVNLGTLGKNVTADVDVWIPDSSTWLLRIAAEAPGFTPESFGSIAESPIVLAVPETTATALGWPARTPGLTDLAKKLATDKSVRPAIVDPARDATGLSGLLALAGAAGTDASATTLKVGIMRALSSNSSSIRSDMLQKFPQAADAVGTSVGLAPLSEADVIAYNRNQPAIGLAALYAKPTAVVLDYPFAVMPGVDPQKADVAKALRGALTTSAYKNGLAKAGVRGADGTEGTGFAAPKSAPATVPPPAAQNPATVSAAIGQLLGSWTAITQPGRMLAVFDVSASMNAKVPTAGGITRAEVTRAVARQGLALLDDRWSVGNWTFSTNMVGTRPWKENLPISTVAAHRQDIANAIEKITPKAGGDTGLYDTALAAYQAVQHGWQAGVSNSVVIYTDGKNDNPGGLTIDQLVDKMTKLRDPKRPIRMIIIGMGTAIDRGELESITKAAGSGGVFIATDPAKIGDIFLQAIASRKGA